MLESNNVTHLFDHPFLHTLILQTWCPVGAEVNTINGPTALLEVTIGEKELPRQLQYSVE